MSLLVQRYMNRTRAAEQLVQSCQSESPEVCRDFEELLGECVDLTEIARHACDTVMSSLYNPKAASAEILSCEDLLRVAFQRTTVVFRTVDKLLAKAQRSGLAIDGVSEFKKAIREVEELGNQIALHWPPVDSNMVEESKAAVQRGEYQLTEEILHGLQGGSAQND